MRNSNYFFNFKIPQTGMSINSMHNSPRLESHGYVFCGTWKKENENYILISVNWQNKKTCKIISNDEFLNLALIS